MREDLKELRKIAEAATPGPWKWEEPSKYEWPMEDQSLIQSEGNESILSGWGYDASGTLAEDVDRAHIATFDPPTVLALLSRLEQAEAQIARVREVIHEYDPDCLTCMCNSDGDCCKCTVADFQEALDGDQE